MGGPTARDTDLIVMPPHSLHGLLMHWSRRCSIPCTPGIDFVGAGGRTCLPFAFLLSCSGLAAPHFSLANMHLLARRSQITRLHQATRYRRQRRFQLFPHVCTGSSQLLTSFSLACSSLRCRFIAASPLSGPVAGPTRCRIGTVPWLCAVSPLNVSMRIRVTAS